MHLLRSCAVVGILAALALAACGAPVVPPPKVAFGDSCRKLFAEVDAKVQAAGVRDGGYYPVDGFPYLRTDRFSASFRDELQDEDKFRAWTENMRQNDVDSREAELTNLGMNKSERTDTLLHLRSCSAWLVHDELENAAWRKHLLDSVSPPDEYSNLARVAGLYPLAAPLFRMGLKSEQEGLRRDYQTPLAQLDSPGPLLLWRVHRTVDPAEVPASLDKAEHDGLGRAGMFLTAWRALVENYAPNLWIETGGDYDRPGVPTLGPQHPGVDTSHPVVYYLETYTRVRDQLLVQLVYFAWFSEHPARSGDAHAGPLDGVVWRVTLDRQARPLLYESIGAGGEHHYLFPVQAFKRRPEADPIAQSVFFPQDQVPGGPVSVRLRSGTHQVRRVAPLEEASRSAEVKDYELRPYEDLLTLPAPKGGTRSLFGSDGVVPGTQRRARWWLWPSGVADAGAMRQWARLPTTLVGRAEFDDPRYLEKLFVDLPSEGPMTAAADPGVEAFGAGTR